MKKLIALAAAVVMAFSVPVSGFAGVTSSVVTHKKIYTTKEYQSPKFSYSTAIVKINKKAANKREYIDVDINYPKIIGTATNVTDFNAANAAAFRAEGDAFIAKYSKEAKKAYETNPVSVNADLPYSLKVEYSMKFNKDSVISVLYTRTTTVAGVKSVEKWTTNYDFIRGQELSVDDVSLINEPGETMQLALDTYARKIRNGKKIYFSDAKVTEEDINFYFDDESVVFFVNPGLIADQSRGVVTYQLLDDVAETYLRKRGQ